MKTEGNDTVTPNLVDGLGGLTKREYFAAMALTGILSDGGDRYSICAEYAVIAADALIHALNQSKES